MYVLPRLTFVCRLSRRLKTLESRLLELLILSAHLRRFHEFQREDGKIEKSDDANLERGSREYQQIALSVELGSQAFHNEKVGDRHELSTEQLPKCRGTRA